MEALSAAEQAIIDLLGKVSEMERQLAEGRATDTLGAQMCGSSNYHFEVRANSLQETNSKLLRAKKHKCIINECIESFRIFLLNIYFIFLGRDDLTAALGQLHRAGGESGELLLPEDVVRWVDAGKAPFQFMVSQMQQTSQEHEATKLRVERIAALRDALAAEVLRRAEPDSSAQAGGVAEGGGAATTTTTSRLGPDTKQE